MMRPLAEQTIVITGATDGLGRALAGELAGRLQSGLDRVDVLVNNARLATPRRDAGSATCPTSSRGLRPAADAESPGVRGAQERGPDQGTTRAEQRRALAPGVNRGLP